MSYEIDSFNTRIQIISRYLRHLARYSESVYL